MGEDIILASLPFNLYTADIPETDSRKFAFANDLAVAFSHKSIESTEEIPNLRQYHRKWRLTPNPGKTECIWFHPNNKLSERKLDITFSGAQIKHNPGLKYLGVTLDPSLTYRFHLVNTAAKVNTRNNIIQKLCGTSWGSSATTLSSSAMGLVYSAAEYCAPLWLNSRHVSELDTQL
ncbi:hypothetical protein JTB14_014318 [Gonioctena quinquepunctata]|nr:hypothetical protein JTB14_014318 [Gonioctena quinquepunctata]